METKVENSKLASENGIQVHHLSCYVAAKKIKSSNTLTIRSPFDGRVVGTVALAGKEDVEAAIVAALAGGKILSRYDRYSVIDQTRQLLLRHKEEFAKIISAESGLCMKETRYEVGRAHDVLLFAGIALPWLHCQMLRT